MRHLSITAAAAGQAATEQCLREEMTRLGGGSGAKPGG